jgi:hypothetical protein
MSNANIQTKSHGKEMNSIQKYAEKMKGINVIQSDLIRINLI